MNKIRKILPFAVLAVLTIVLMFYFKENRGNFGEMVKKGTSDLLSFYTQNLEPLLFETELTNEDVFNFALYQTLPVDKQQNRSIKINDHERGSYYELAHTVAGDPNLAYNDFIDYMNLAEYEKSQLDSILESYKGEISEAVLVNDQKTVAINARLSDLQKAVLTDIATFSQRINNTKMSDILGDELAIEDFAVAQNMVDNIKKDTSKQFIVIAKDTVFASRLHFNSDLLEKRIDSLRHKMSRVNKDKKLIVAAEPQLPKPPKILSEKDLEYNFNYEIDSNSTFVFQPRDMNLGEMYWVKTEEYDSLRVSLNKLQKRISKIQFDLNFDSLEKSLQINFSEFEEDSLKNLNINMNFERLGEIISRSLDASLTGNKSEKEWEKFGREMDSLANEFVKVKGDSAAVKRNEIRKKINELKKKREP